MNVTQIPIEDSFVIHVTNFLEDDDFKNISKFLNFTLKNKQNTITSIDDDNSVNKAVQPILSKIQTILLKNFGYNFVNTGYQITKNRQTKKDWHIHRPQFKNEDVLFETKECYVCVTYLHEKWDKQYGGELILGNDRNNFLAKFDSDPNSCIIHNRKYYHGVNWMDLQDSNLTRMSMFSHWYKDI